MHRMRVLSYVTALLAVAPAARAATTEFFDHAAFEAAAEVRTVVVDFEDTQRGNGLALGAEFSEQGLSIVQRDGQPMNLVTVGAGFAFPENASSAEQVLSSSIGLGGTFTDRSDSFDFVFTRPKRVAGLWIGNVDPGTTAVEFLDAEGTVLASESIDGSHEGVVGTPGGPNRLFYGVVSDPPVARIRTIEGTGDSDGVTYDDVEFEAATEFFDHEAFRAHAGWRLATRDFETLAGTVAGTEYAEPSPDGVRIVHRGGAALSIVLANGPLTGNASSGLRVLSSSILPDRSFTDGADDVDFEPVQPMRAAGIWIGNLDPGTTEVQFLDASGAVLAREVFDSSHAGVVGDPGGANRVFYGIASDAAIARIRVVEPAGDADGVTFDDVQFSPDLSPAPRIRVLTTNIWQSVENAAVREQKLVAWIRDFGPDLVAFQEAKQSGITLALAALGYNVRHQIFGATLWTDEGVVLGSRWPIEPSLAERVSLEMDGAREYPYALVRGVVAAPFPIGRFYFLNSKPAWQTSQADQRLVQNGILMDVLETDTRLRGGHPGAAAGLFQIVAGDFDDAPTTPSVQFLTNAPNLLRDSWVEAGDGSPGYTFAQPPAGAPPRPNNYSLPYTGPGDYQFGDRRIDYVFARDGASREVAWHASRVVFDGKGAEWVSGHHGVFADLRPVPEPSAALLALASLGVLGAFARRLRRAGARAQGRLARFTGSACAVASIGALGASPAAAAPDVSILTLNLWHWVEPARNAVGTLLDEIDDLPAAGAGGPTFLVLQEVSLPLVDDALAAKGYFLVAEGAASTGIGKVVATKTEPYHARFTNRFGEACTGVCDIVETCTIAGGDPICVLDVHSQAWQVDPPCEVPPAVSCPLPGSNDAYREELSRTIVARTRELARGGFLVLVAGDFNAPVDATSISTLYEAGLVDAWNALGLPECTQEAPGACTLVDNPIEGNIVPFDVPDHRRIDHLFAYGAASGDAWQSAEVRFDGGSGGPRVSGQNGVLGVHGGPGAFDGVTPEGEYDVNLTCTSGCSGLYPHRMRITTWNPSTGSFAGTGFYVPDPSIHWIVEGTTSGSSYALTYTYVGSNAGFVGTASGVLDATGAPTTGAGGTPSNTITYTWAAARRSLDPRARYEIDMTLCGPSGCPGTVTRHTMDLGTWSPATGAFRGRGRWNDDPAVTWSVEGSVSGSRFDLVFTYDGTNAGYQGTVVGAIDPDGRLHFGLGSDNASTVNRFAFDAIAVPEPASACGAAAATLALVTWARSRSGAPRADRRTSRPS